MILMWLEIMFGVSAAFAQTSGEATLALLRDAVASCGRHEYKNAGEKFTAVIDETNGIGPRLLYADCLEKQSQLVEARDQCRRALERAQVAVRNAQTNKDEASAQQDEKESRACVDDLEKRIPNLLVFVSGPGAEGSELKLYINGKSLDSSQWGKPYPMNPGSWHITGQAVGNALAPMDATLVEGRNQSLQIAIPLPVEWKVHRPSLLVGLGISLGVLSAIPFGFTLHHATVASEKQALSENPETCNIPDGTRDCSLAGRWLLREAQRNATTATVVGVIGLGAFVAGATMLGIGIRELRGGPPNGKTVSFYVGPNGAGIGGTF